MAKGGNFRLYIYFLTDFTLKKENTQPPTLASKQLTKAGKHQDWAQVSVRI